MWIYKKTRDNSARFVLGEEGSRPLICFGINSSTAAPKNLDPTVTRVQRTAQNDKRFDGWIMLNLYPQRATNPHGIHKQIDETLHKENLKSIVDIFKKYPKAFVWQAWGNLIEKRSFLKDCKEEIFETIRPYSPEYHRRGKRTKNGHPRHPLYLNESEKFEKININIEISIKRQTLKLSDGKSAIKKYKVSTAVKGTGSDFGSNKTPIGKHRVCEKIGNGAAIGTVFQVRKNTGIISNIYEKRSQYPYSDEGDCITTRILRLEGLEEGRNKGEGIDSFERCVYIHGTPYEYAIGNPSSHGCIRMKNQEIIELFNIVNVGDEVKIINE